MRDNWRGLIKVLSIQCVSKDGNIVWERKNLYNILHTDGEQFLLNCLFVGGQTSTYIPSDYYFGLDNRGTIAVADTMSSLVAEPTTNGYERQTVSSLGTFTVSVQASNYRADTPLLTFEAIGGNWGPITTLFMTDKSDDSGTLISSVNLGTSVTVVDGHSLIVKMGLSLKDV